jgi:hypothetical protein
MSCRNTLRQETVDFWEYHENRRHADGPGYFHFKF